ncbi:MAG: DNA-directed RNA polymerase subunit omega [Mariprofundaceae bacterium]|nr:DNA-directed RNA polymerase subunit omega [Mariprofundaceae bacterium]
MARVTIEDCIRYYPNRFEMVLLAGRRARQLLNGMAPIVDDEPHKPVVQALREMGDGQVSWEGLFELDKLERQRLQAASREEVEEAV